VGGRGLSVGGRGLSVGGRGLSVRGRGLSVGARSVRGDGSSSLVLSDEEADNHYLRR
jgi:hypothetical protein